MRRTAAIACVILAMLLPASVSAQVTQADIDEARQKVRDISAALGDEAVRIEEAYQRELALREEHERLVTDLAVREQELARARADARDRVLEMYMLGTDGGAEFTAVFEAETLDDMSTRVGYLDTVAAADRTVVNHLITVRDSFLGQQEALEEALVRQEETRREIAEIEAAIAEELTAANDEYQAIVAAWERQEEERRRREEEERLRREAEAAAATSTTTTTTTAPATTTTEPVTTTTAGGGGEGEATTTTVAEETTTTSAPPETTTTTTAPETTTTTTPPPPPPNPAGRVCPVDGPHAFTDTWGAPRGGGRTHEGVDMMAARGTPLVAVESGIIGRKSIGNLSGLSLWIYGESGDHFFYAHLDTYADGLSQGQRVTVGQRVGTVGNTGNAIYTAPHLHFEYHPDGGRAVNPTPLVEELCR